MEFLLSELEKGQYDSTLCFLCFFSFKRSVSLMEKLKYYKKFISKKHIWQNKLQFIGKHVNNTIMTWQNGVNCNLPQKRTAKYYINAFIKYVWKKFYAQNMTITCSCMIQLFNFCGKFTPNVTKIFSHAFVKSKFIKNVSHRYCKEEPSGRISAIVLLSSVNLNFVNPWIIHKQHDMWGRKQILRLLFIVQSKSEVQRKNIHWVYGWSKPKDTTT